MTDKKIKWQSDLGNGYYRNPILYADYSDPDVIRVNEDYFMVASSFCNVPAIPLLHSKDLVNWRVVRYILDKLPSPKYDRPAHGHGVWAPSIRYHHEQYWVCFPMPDEGIYFTVAKNPFGAWSEPFSLREGSGWIDPCPLWDDDGKAYMVSAFAKSRIGFKSVLNLAEMKPDGTGLIDDGRHIYDGHNTQPTIEGPKLYKRNGYYYILAPAGGVKYGWQTALRAKNIWGPYEEKIVMLQGGAVNGPHQGGLVDTPDGQWWFIHFQDVGVCGRIVHLQPVHWMDDWPVIGDDTGNEGFGYPVGTYPKPAVSASEPLHSTKSDREGFDHNGLGLQWQWNANPKQNYYAFEQGLLKLPAQNKQGKLCDEPALLLQKFAMPSFSAVVKMDIGSMENGALAGMIVLGGTYGALAFTKKDAQTDIRFITGKINDGDERMETLAALSLSGCLYIKLAVNGDECTFSYGVDGDRYFILTSFVTTPGVWVGAKFGLFSFGSSGHVLIHYCRAFEV